MDPKERRDLAPSERGLADQQAEAQMRERAENRAASMRQDFTKTFQTAHGRRVAAWLRKRCGHNQIILSADRQSGKLDPHMTLFAAMELNLYLEIRKHLPTELLQEIEDDRRIEPSGTISDTSTGRTAERASTRSRRTSRSE